MQNKRLLCDLKPQLWLRKFSQNRASEHYPFLSSEEKNLVARRATEALREEATISFGLRRQILAHLLNIPPQDLIFDQEAQGKPVLKNTFFHFNVSHSGDYWVMLTDPQYSVGIDVEDMRRQVEFKELATRFFTSKEARLVNEAENSCDVFWYLWTGKEALLKATGEGIVQGLAHIEILRDENGKYFIASEVLAKEWDLAWCRFEEGLVAKVIKGTSINCLFSR